MGALGIALDGRGAGSGAGGRASGLGGRDCRSPACLSARLALSAPRAPQVAWAEQGYFRCHANLAPPSLAPRLRTLLSPVWVYGSLDAALSSPG